MNRARLTALWPWLALFAAALGLGLAAGGGKIEDSAIPSVENPGPRGARVLYTWLTESGAHVELLQTPWKSVPPDVQVLVIAAPTARTLNEDDTARLEEFVRGGGTLLYFSPRPITAQPEMAKWLSLKETGGTTPLIGDPSLKDFGGATLDIASSWPWLKQVKQLRVSSDTGLAVDGPEAIGGNALWHEKMGRGEIWIAAGADLLENRRLELLDNSLAWANLAGQWIAFDEFHLTPPPSPPWSANLWATLGQCGFVALVYVAARGRRLGPGRPTPVREHRSSLEYVASMAGLMRRAGVERPLQGQLRARLRRLMQDRLGIALTLSSEEASRALAAQTELPADAFARLDARLQAGSTDFAEVAAEAARLEDAIVGRRPS